MARRRSRPLAGTSPLCALIGCETPCTRTSSTCAPTMAISTIGMSTMCHISIWPKFITSKNAPTPAALNASLPLVEIHWESKFCWDR